MIMSKREIPAHLLQYFRSKTVYKPKDDAMIPHRLYGALMDDGWWGRSTICWQKLNVMPSPVKDRPTTSHEYVFLCSKSRKYYYDQGAIREPSQANEETKKRATYGRYDAETGNAKRDTRTGKPDYLQKVGNDYGGAYRNKRTVWTVNTKPYKAAHFATFPPDLIRPMILAGSRRGDIVFDPFMGAGTTGVVAVEENRRWFGIDANQDYCDMATNRIFNAQPTLF